MIRAIEITDEIETIRARARLLELALLGAEKTGHSLDGGVYLDAVRQGIADIADGLDQVARGKALAGAQPCATACGRL